MVAYCFLDHPIGFHCDKLISLQVFQDGPRIEAAFRKYVHRATSDQSEDSYEIIVCHANVIRYFVCRRVVVHFLSLSKIHSVMMNSHLGGLPLTATVH